MLTRVPRGDQQSTLISRAGLRLTGRVQAVCKKEICEEIEERLWESSDLSNR